MSPRCVELEDEIDNLRQRLAAVGQDVVASAGPEPGSRLRTRAATLGGPSSPVPPAAAGFRAGWARFARVVGPRLREWEARWWHLARENDSLRSRLGTLIAEISRLNELR